MSRVSKRYAKALFETALEEKKLNNVHKDLEHLKSILKESDDFSGFVSNPLVSDSNKLTIVEELFKGKVDSLTMKFLTLVCESKRLYFIAEIIQQFEYLLRHHNNQVVAEISSAVSLSDEQIKKITKKIQELTGKNVITQHKTDESLIGGFLVKIEDIIIDNSIRYQLLKLKEKLVA